VNSWTKIAVLFLISVVFLGWGIYEKAQYNKRFEKYNSAESLPSAEDAPIYRTPDFQFTRKQDKEVKKVAGELNAYLLQQRGEYEGETHRFVLPKKTPGSLGVTQDLFYQGRQVGEGDPQGRGYCIGLMLEVYLNACADYARENWGTAEYQLAHIDAPGKFAAFRRDFYGVSGNRRTMVDALAKRNLGREIRSLDRAKPGDLLQIWRQGGSGHAVIYLAHKETPAGDPISVTYWSIQSSTGGISTHTESFGDEGADLDPEQVYIVRAFPPSQISS